MSMRFVARRTRLGAIRPHAMDTCCDHGQGLIQSGLLSEGVASPEEIDQGMKLGCNHPIGPLALADMIGLDTLLAVMEVLYAAFAEPKYRPAMR